MSWKTLDDIDLTGKRVLVRVDINVPVENGLVTDATRIDRIAPTVTDILAKGGRPILLAHFGRPKGKVVLDMSLRVTVPALEAALGRKVRLIETLEGAENLTDEALASDVLLLENIRFHPGEEANDPAFAARLAQLGDIYCNDAFSAAHRAHASTEGLARHLPSCAGRLMQAELQALEAALGTPKRPVVAVVGGAKVSTKLDLLGNLVAKVDSLIIGGGMANTFLAAMGLDVGKSLCEHDMTATAREIMLKAGDAGCKIVLPADVVVARDFAAGAPHEVVGAHACPPDAMILDAGPQAVARIIATLDAAKTLIWNGPLGAFEIAPFDTATNAAASHAAQLSRAGKLISVAGGGDTVAALNKSGAAEDFTYISTAGGAFLEWMEGKDLPGVAALKA
ncbi:Phosphoglycerate kinase [Roseovarius sp. EC-HK134]|uniref:Phosphoglycerate kinase n=1 Tax=Roseovarius mucosus TaxID=215743 RepID=A0A1V0RK93_9RHOB|nr:MULTISPECIES: phosphoglycerate kinase [Roseovarius]ARE82203.1 phosphoglycerate kinase [Roseovarius mucosus]AWZ22245.1 Phosphoglycerate kinase [Roseovarius sp. AK1035]EDM30517.1 phosphoglycerate kinase [Roseovarius sp. TM1035]MBW4972527.1 phosphoglycerate kinase [Roseovarius mucosus]VVT25993.1 Phosphoglycerate kinase [Roseovarius sp. EC-HK134]|tara:strand:+ start:1916 stop:3100 length:1185 start_codon:yes stop_codon:yes gene_type:complete